MSGLERHNQELADREKGDATAAYTTTALGVAFVVAAVLITITAGTPAAGVGFLIGAAACLGWGVPQIWQRRRLLPAPVDKEGELLSAIRDNGGSITPAEAAVETSLTVSEADQMLSELTTGGHLRVETDAGMLVYTLPSSRSSELEG